jgi:hypothetical protein
LLPAEAGMLLPRQASHTVSIGGWFSLRTIFGGAPASSCAL